MTAPRDERAEPEAVTWVVSVVVAADGEPYHAEAIASPRLEAIRRQADRDWPEDAPHRVEEFESRATSRARLERVVEGLRMKRPAIVVIGEGFEAYPGCETCEQDEHDCLCSIKADAHNAALDAVLTAMQGEG